MPKLNQKTRTVIAAAFCLLIGAAVFSAKIITRAQNEPMMLKQEEMLLKCFFDPKTLEQLTPEETKQMGEYRTSPYADWEKSPNEIITLYHEKINERFNDYIKKMLTAAKDCMNAKPDAACNKNSQPPPRKADGTIEKCTPENFSTYCVATTLYSDRTIGYTMMRDIVECRKYELFEKAKQGKPYSESTKAGKARNEADQATKAMDASIKAKAIEDKVTAAKKALDTTLSAYDQLRGSWLIHKRYMKIYKSLLKYRDKLVEIRRSVETFPAKFIDASTTRCI